MTAGRESNLPGAAQNKQTAGETPPHLWLHRLGTVLFSVFCFELGVFLLVFPWLEVWNRNLLWSFLPELRSFWLSPYFRGAVSGVGLLNFYISFSEILKLWRPPLVPAQNAPQEDSVE